MQDVLILIVNQTSPIFKLYSLSIKAGNLFQKKKSNFSNFEQVCEKKYILVSPIPNKCTIKTYFMLDLDRTNMRYFFHDREHVFH